MTLSITDTQYNNAVRYAECHHAECRVLFTVTMSVNMLNVVVLSVVMLNVIMLNVVAPLNLSSLIITKGFCNLIIIKS